MSTATITPIVTSRSGSDFTSASQAANPTADLWAGTGKEWLVVNNGSGSSITVTLAYSATGGVIDGQTLPNRTVTVAAGHTEIIGPFPTGLYNDASGNVSVSYSAVTTVKVAVYQLGT
jgi:hypothetical protein